VRNAATLGGNLMTNARNADGVAALMALGATVVTASNSGESRMPIDPFVSTPKKEKLANGGIVKQFEVPCLTDTDRWAWEKLKQRQGDGRSIVSVSLRAKMEGKICRGIRLVLGAMAAHPFVSKTAVKILEAKPVSPDLVDQVAKEILDETNAATDTRATAWYRQRATQALVRRVLSQLT
jgi:CO/xanthine dehydrogenase FAD-binding subunit